MTRSDRLPAVLLGLLLVAMAISAIRPHDLFTWFLEVGPILIVVPILLATHRRFPLTPLAHVLMFAHALILVLGAHYTYALVPLGDWARDVFDFERNHYDRIGHFAQGFVPAIVAREVLLRCSPIRGKWLVHVVMATCLGFAAVYELIEWWAALLTEGGATAFLGTQGDPWDSQWDMFLCGVGAALALLLLSRLHDRQLRKHALVPS